MTTLHDFVGVLGQPSDPLFWALTISWSRLLARVISDPTFPPMKVSYWRPMSEAKYRMEHNHATEIMLSPFTLS